MGEAYTPGLEVREATIVRKRRVLPIPGETLVKKGDKVQSIEILDKSVEDELEEINIILEA